MKIETYEGNEIVTIEHNNMTCYYYAASLERPHELREIAKELEEFYRYFFDIKM